MEDMDPKRVILITCVSIDFDLDYLPHFVRHYSKLDIDEYRFILHSKEEIVQDVFLKLFENLFKDTKAEYKLEFWSGVFKYYDKVDRLNNLIQQQVGTYYVLADVDEFQIWPDSIKNSIISNKGEIVWGTLRDREAPEGSNTVLDSTIDIDKQFNIISNKSNWNSDLYIKPIAFNSSYTLRGCHDIVDVDKFKAIEQKATVIQVDHYRWNDKRLDKMIERHENYKAYNREEFTKDTSYVLSMYNVKHKSII
jgi:hypothetical protein